MEDIQLRPQQDSLENNNALSSTTAHLACLSSSHSQGTRPRNSSWCTAIFPLSPRTPSPSQLEYEKEVSFQNRRLRLRHAGFRAAQLPALRISDRLATCRVPSWAPVCESDKAKGSGSFVLENQRSTSANSAQGCIDILRESSSSFRSGRSRAARQSLTTIFRVEGEASESAKQTDGLGPGASAGRNLYASQSPDSQSSSSDFTKHDKRRKRTFNIDTARYIEYLEGQLESQMEEVGSLSVKVPKGKLRSLNAEIKSLKRELTEWKSEFDARVFEATGVWIENDSSLRAKIRALEGQIEAHLCRIKELEYENETQARRLRNAESLTQTNRNLERRVDVLTELLAQSPSRQEMSRSPLDESAPWSPRINGKRLSRPKSMMPCVLHSPKVDVLQPPVHSPVLEQPEPAHDILIKNTQVEEPPLSAPAEPLAQRSSDNVSARLSSNTSLSGLSVPKSQRSSTTSQSSVSSAWGLPLPAIPDDQARRSRKMRRFPSGSCNLKPLILPTATATVAIASHSPLRDEHTHPIGFRKSGSPLDPGAAYLDEQLHDSDVKHSESPSWAQNESLNALEGRSQYYNSYAEAVSHQFMTVENKPEELSRAKGLGLVLGLNSPLSNSEMSHFTHSDEPPGNFSFAVKGSTTVEKQSDSSRPRSSSLLSVPNDNVKPLSRDLRAALKRFQTRNQVTPSVFVRSEFAAPPSKRKLSDMPADCAPTLAKGFLRAVKMLGPHCFKNMYHQYIDLIRRILRHALHRGWSRFGFLSKWILGLFFGPKFRDKWTAKRRSAAENYDWHRFSFQNHMAPSEFGMDNGLQSSNCASNQFLSAASQRFSTNPGTPSLNRYYTKGQTGLTKRLSALLSPLSQSLALWAKFSLALVLAIGFAVKDGPASLMGDYSRQERSNQSCRMLLPEHSPQVPCSLDHAHPSVESITGFEDDGNWPSPPGADGSYMYSLESLPQLRLEQVLAG